MKRKIALIIAAIMLFQGASVSALPDTAASSVDVRLFDTLDNDISLFDDGDSGDDPDSGTDPSTDPDTDSQLTDLSDKLAEGSILIDKDGNYIISDYSGSNTITVEEGITAQLTLKNVSIAASNAAPIKLKSTAILTLNVEGSNVLKSTTAAFAGIAVYADDTTSKYATLIIDGDGSLEVTGGKEANAIGANKKNKDGASGISGKIVIKGSTITATGGTNASAIGCSYFMSAANLKSGDIEITGGFITAVSGNSSKSPAIGGSGEFGVNGNITITGGTVIAESGNLGYGIGPGSKGVEANCGSVVITGGSVNASVSSKCSPVDNSNIPVSMVVFQMDAANAEVSVDSWTAITDDEGKIYVYLPEDTESFALQYNDSIYLTQEIDRSNVNDLTIYTGDPCSCDTTGNPSVEFDMPSEISVNTIDKIHNEKLNVVYHTDCTFPLHPLNITYKIFDDEGEMDDASVAYISRSYLTLTDKAIGKNIVLKAHVVMNSLEFDIEHNISVSADRSANFDLSKGGVEIYKISDDDDHVRIVQGSAEKIVDVNDDTTIRIFQSSSNPTSNTIYVSGGLKATITLDNLNIAAVYNQETNTYPLRLTGENTDLTLKLVGDNHLTGNSGAAISGNAQSSLLTIEGDGTLYATVDEEGQSSSSGIGQLKTFTVNSGTVIAEGTGGGAGIGGSNDADGIGVVVNGGRVYATGSLNAAGIGGGSNKRAGGDFTINGGLVVASSESGLYGIGQGGESTKTGTITVNGGSLIVTPALAVRPQNNLSRVKNQYLVKVKAEDIDESKDIKYSIGENEPISTTTDEDGYLYLYLNPGTQWIRMYDGETVYYKYCTVSDKDASGAVNVFTCVSNPKVELTFFEIPGQTESTIDNNERTVSVTVPGNISLSDITPSQPVFEGAFADYKGLDFDNSSHSDTFIIYGDNNIAYTYTVTLTLEDYDPSTPDEYDISKGPISIRGDAVTYGSVIYSPNPNGYIITGVTDKNSLTLDYAEEKLPQVILEGVQITSSGNAFKVNSTADIIVRGNCSFTSINADAIEVDNPYSDTPVNLNVTGDDEYAKENNTENILSVQGGVGKHAVSLKPDTVMKVLDLTSSFVGGLATDALDGDGEFITDGKRAMRIPAYTSSALTPKDTDSHLLYQLSAQLKTEDTTQHFCIYNDAQYYLWNDHTLYLLVPEGEYTVDVLYGEDELDFIGERNAVIKDGLGDEISLYTIEVTNVSYTGGLISAEGKTIDFTVDGTIVNGNVKIRLKSDETPSKVYEDTVQDYDGVSKAFITVPENSSDETRVTYTVYYVITDEETPLQTKIIVEKNGTVCKITAFKIANQIGEEEIILRPEESYNIINITMPYDHQFAAHKNYTPEDIQIKGRTVAPDKETPQEFTLDVNGYMRASYIVYAREEGYSSTYQVRLRKETTPQILTLRFKQPETYAGGSITVTARGKATNSIYHAEEETNRDVYIYADGIAPVKATRQVEDGVDIYVADIEIPQNDDVDAEKTYVLKAKIGDVEQTSVNTSTATVRVPRKNRSLTGIASFTIEHSLSRLISGKNIYVTMPYDASLIDLEPEIILEDIYAEYSPTGLQDFTEDVQYTVTAENGTDKEVYTAHVTNQNTPKASSINFTNPKYSSAGRIAVTVNGSDLENAKDALNHSKEIIVGGIVSSPNSDNSDITSAAAELDENGNYVANIIVPPNNTDAQRTYNLFVRIGGVDQNLSGNIVLTVPAKESNSKELSDLIIDPKQSDLVFSSPDYDADGNGYYRVYLDVPYNTDLRNITPGDNLRYAIDATCDPDPNKVQDFSFPVTYRITAEDDSFNEYEIHVSRGGAPKVTNVSVLTDLELSQPRNFSDTNLTLDISGQFIPKLNESTVKDELELYAVYRDDESVTTGTIEYDDEVYGGHATGHLKLPANTADTDKIYDLYITLNGEQQIFNASTITVPARKSRHITSFIVNGQLGSQISDVVDNKGTILFTVPYDTDLTKIQPRIRYDGDEIDPDPKLSGLFDFDKKSVNFTVSADGDDEDVTYTVSAQRDNLPTISSVKLSNLPDTFWEETVDIDVTGVFFYDMEVYAVSGDERIKGTVTKNDDGSLPEWYKASAKIDIPTNYDEENDKVYELEFYLDGKEDPIVYSPVSRIVVPKRKTKAITDFTITNQVGIADIQEKDIYVKVRYNTNIRELTTNLVIDGDSYSVNGEKFLKSQSTKQNFDNDTKSLVYSVTAEDDTVRDYTVHVSRDGDPTISKLTFSSPGTFNGGSVPMIFEGIFFETLEVTATSDDGEEVIKGTTITNEKGLLPEWYKATASVVIPPNDKDYENSKTYHLSFVVDGKPTAYIGNTDIIVPRRTTRKINSFYIPGTQEGETRYDGTTINIDIPYHLPTLVTPEIDYDANRSITPDLSEPQEFGDPDNPVKYTLSSWGDTDVTYTINVTRIGHDPYLISMNVPDMQAKDTEYDKDDVPDTVSIVLKSNANLREIEPVLEIDEDADYRPKGPVDFSQSKTEPVEYTVFNKYGIEHKYYVTITKKSSGNSSAGGSGSDPKTTPTPEPTASPEPTESPKPTPEVTPVPTSYPSSGNKPYINGSEDENGNLLFRPDDSITRAEVAKILSVLDDDFDGNKKYEKTLTDIPDGAWYENYMNFAVLQGYISGYDDGTSRSESMITRAEFVSMLSRYVGLEADEEIPDMFSDIARFEWCRAQINTFAEMGIVSGYDDGTFLPDNLITRSEAVTMINKILERHADDDLLRTIKNPFADVSDTHWAYANIMLASCEY